MNVNEKNGKEVIVQIEERKIKVGEWFQLNDLLNQDIKETGFYNGRTVNPLDICLPSDQDFKTVFLENKESLVLARLHRLFSLSFFRIEKIVITDGECFLFSNRLKVDLLSALHYGEISFVDVDSGITNSIAYQRDSNLIKEVSKIYERLLQGSLSEEEAILSMDKFYSKYMNLQNKWKINNKKQHDGSFYSIKAVDDFLAKYNKDKA